MDEHIQCSAMRMRNSEVPQSHPSFRFVSRFNRVPLQHLQPGGPGVFPTRRYDVAPYEGASLGGGTSQGYPRKPPQLKSALKVGFSKRYKCLSAVERNVPEGTVGLPIRAAI